MWNVDVQWTLRGWTLAFSHCCTLISTRMPQDKTISSRNKSEGYFFFNHVSERGHIEWLIFLIELDRCTDPSRSQQTQLQSVRNGIFKKKYSTLRVALAWCAHFQKSWCWTYAYEKSQSSQTVTVGNYYYYHSIIIRQSTVSGCSTSS